MTYVAKYAVMYTNFFLLINIIKSDIKISLCGINIAPTRKIELTLIQ